MSKSHCKGCGARVVFAIDENGKNQILDPKPPVYDVALSEVGNSSCGRIRGGMVSHFATCPKASQFSKKKELAKS